MYDLFLMGTIGTSGWREPIKKACLQVGVTFFDPIVPVWNEEAKRRETEALATSRVIVMAITSDTASIASLAESGWVAASAMLRKQIFGIYIDPVFGDEAASGNTGMTGFGGWLLDTFLGGRERQQNGAASKPESLDEASRRARKLAISHMTKLKGQHPDLPIYMMGSLAGLQEWAIKTAKRLKETPVQQPTKR